MLLVNGDSRREDQSSEEVEFLKLTPVRIIIKVFILVSAYSKEQAEYEGVISAAVCNAHPIQCYWISIIKRLVFVQLLKRSDAE